MSRRRKVQSLPLQQVGHLYIFLWFIYFSFDKFSQDLLCAYCFIAPYQIQKGVASLNSLEHLLVVNNYLSILALEMVTIFPLSGVFVLIIYSTAETPLAVV